MESEDAIREHCRAGDFHGAATGALRAYGPEVLGLLRALHRNEDEAADAFSAFTHDFWVALPRFEWASSMRTWMFVLARHASARQRANAGRRARVERNVQHPSELADVAERVRTDTLPFVRTDVRDRFRALRDALAEDDRAILVLRVDKNLDFKDIARVLSGPDRTLDAHDLVREAARVRKRFQLVKDKLRRAGRDAGLLSNGEDEP